MNSLPLRRPISIALLGVGLASAELASIRRKVEEHCPKVAIIDDPGPSAAQALAMQDQIEQSAIRDIHEYQITCSDPISCFPHLSLFHTPRPTRYEPHVGRKQLLKKNGTR